jgi:hypothetical protein
MRNAQTQNWPAATSSDSTWSAAGKLSRKVGEWAHRSYQFLTTRSRTDAPVQASPEDVVRDYRDLRDQIAGLQPRSTSGG